MRLTSLLGILLLLSWAQITAQTCCSGGVPVSSNLGFQSASKSSLQVSLSADFNFLKTLKSGSHRLEDNNRLRTTQSYILRSAYSFSNRFTIEGFLPLVRQTRRITTNSGALDKEQTFGVGDPVALLIYNLLNKDVVLRIGAGPQIPLGSFDIIGSRGLTLLEDLQPGSGAWDLIIFASAEFQLPTRPSSLIYVNSLISKTGTNNRSRSGSQSYSFGDDLQVIAGFSDQLLLGKNIISPGISFRYRHANRDQVNTTQLPGTGGNFVFMRLSNGIPFPKLKSSLAINVELPIWNHVNDTQLSPTIGLNIGWFYKFEKEQAYDSIIDLN